MERGSHHNFILFNLLEFNSQGKDTKKEKFKVFKIKYSEYKKNKDVGKIKKSYWCHIVNKKDILVRWEVGLDHLVG